jgi:hypothetical protein
MPILKIILTSIVIGMGRTRSGCISTKADRSDKPPSSRAWNNPWWFWYWSWTVSVTSATYLVVACIVHDMGFFTSQQYFPCPWSDSSLWLVAGMWCTGVIVLRMGSVKLVRHLYLRSSCWVNHCVPSLQQEVVSSRLGVSDRRCRHSDTWNWVGGCSSLV